MFSVSCSFPCLYQLCFKPCSDIIFIPPYSSAIIPLSIDWRLYTWPKYLNLNILIISFSIRFLEFFSALFFKGLYFFLLYLCPRLDDAKSGWKNTFRAIYVLLIVCPLHVIRCGWSDLLDCDNEPIILHNTCTTTWLKQVSAQIRQQDIKGWLCNVMITLVIDR